MMRRAALRRAAIRARALFTQQHPALAGAGIAAAHAATPSTLATPLDYTCWELRYPDGSPVDGASHFPTREAALADLDDGANDTPVAQLAGPCWQAVAGCGYILDEDTNYPYHLTTPAEAVDTAVDHGWTVAVSTATPYLHCGADNCACNPDVAAVQQTA